MKKYNIAIFDMAPSHYRTPIYTMLAKKNNIDFTVYFSSDYGTKKQFNSEYNTRIKWEIDLSKFKHKFLTNYYLGNPELKPSRLWNLGTVKEIIKNKFDAVVIVGYSPVSHKLAIITARLMNIPIILKEEIDLFQKNNSIKWKIKDIAFKLFFKKIGAFIYGYKKNKEFYKYYGSEREKLFFFPCAVNNEMLQYQRKNLSSKVALRMKLNIPKNKLVGVLIGRLVKGKNSMDAVRAFERLSNKAFLLIIGDGEDKEKIKKYIIKKNIKNIKLVGFVPQSKIGNYLKASDVYMLPSEIDRSSKSLNDAMNFGLVPIVSDKVPTAQDLIKGKKTGFIHKNGDIENIIEILRELFKNQKILKLKQKNSEKIIKLWNFNKDIKGLMGAIEYVTKTKKN